MEETKETHLLKVGDKVIRITQNGFNDLKIGNRYMVYNASTQVTRQIQWIQVSELGGSIKHQSFYKASFFDTYKKPINQMTM